MSAGGCPPTTPQNGHLPPPHLLPLQTQESPLSLLEQEGPAILSKLLLAYGANGTQRPRLPHSGVQGDGDVCSQPLLRRRSLPLPGPPVQCSPGSPRPSGRERRDRMPLSASAPPTVGPPLLIPVYFQYQIITAMIVRRDWVVSQAYSWPGRGGAGAGGPGGRHSAPAPCPPGWEGGLFTLRKGLALGLPGAGEATALHIPPLPTHRGVGGGVATAFAELPQKAPGGDVMRAKLDPPVCRSGRCLPCVRIPLQP